MSIGGFSLILNDYCAYCPDFEPEVNKIDVGDFAFPHRAFIDIRCRNAEKCAVIAQNLMDRMRENGKTDA